MKNHASDKPDKRDQEIQNLKLEILQNNKLLKSYEENSLKMTELEKKLRNQNTKHEKDIKIYAEKIKALNKKIEEYEEKLKNFTKYSDTSNYATKYSYNRGAEKEHSKSPVRI